MDVNLDVKTHQFSGTQELTYYNNSPDTLKRVFYHLYFNAFQPNSMMDVRSRTIADPDRRVGSRIVNLSKNEIGKQQILSLKQDGLDVKYEHVGTILEVDLAKPILPNTKTLFSMKFSGQVPIQIRRSGRDNAEGVAYTMTQWYPKMAEYDYQGWHANPYIGREFHGVWGDFDVKLTLDASYVVAGTGYIQNPNTVGHGYETGNLKIKHEVNKMLTWHFKAPNVHDFAWAADPDYKHLTHKVKNGPTLHFFYQPDGVIDENWEKLPEKTEQMLHFLNTNYGKYPYDQYSVIQGGDGGMEYAMATMITGKRTFKSLVGVTVHEVVHSWYQQVLATNEALYAWMDEGFTSYVSAYTMQHLFNSENKENPTLQTVKVYANIKKSGQEEPLRVHSDHYTTNRKYSVGSYVKGSVILTQLEYILGKKMFNKAFRNYYNSWKFKHPTPNSFKRVMEKISGLELDWYFEYYMNTTHSVDYAVEDVNEFKKGKTSITLSRLGNFPMPVELSIYLKNGKLEKYYIPLKIMRAEKQTNMNIASDWQWTNPTYNLLIDHNINSIERIIIDELNYTADVSIENNSFLIE